MSANRLRDSRGRFVRAIPMPVTCIVAIPVVDPEIVVGPARTVEARAVVRCKRPPLTLARILHTIRGWFDPNVGGVRGRLPHGIA